MVLSTGNTKRFIVVQRSPAHAPDRGKEASIGNKEPRSTPDLLILKVPTR